MNRNVVIGGVAGVAGILGVAGWYFLSGPGGLIGYCAGAFSTGEESGGRAELVTLYLVRSAQRLGLGRRLLTSSPR